MSCFASPSPRRRNRAWIFSVAAVLTGCTVGPNFHAPAPPDSTRFTEAVLPGQTVAAATRGGEAQRFGPDRDIPGEWWGLFHSPPITTLVTRALKSNPDIAAAQATLRQARETTRAEQGALFPTVGASAQLERQRESF